MPGDNALVLNQTFTESGTTGGFFADYPVSMGEMRLATGLIMTGATNPLIGSGISSFIPVQWASGDSTPLLIPFKLPGEYDDVTTEKLELLLDINNLGLPIAVEALDLISPQYLQDLVAWTAIGARTTESPTHRKLSSGISSAVGFKNGVDGSLTVAVNAIRSASAENSFISVTDEGKVAAFRTSGNPHCHVILRGGKEPNYAAEFVARCEEDLRKASLPENIMIDCSHGNSQKNHLKQLDVLESITQQIESGNKSIIGMMLESNLCEGNQPIPADLEEIRYGVSVTDACINWEATEQALRGMASRIKPHLAKRV